MKKIKTVKVASEYNLADLLTKCHPAARFKQLLDLMHAKAQLH